MEVVITANQSNSLKGEMCLKIKFCSSFVCQLSSLLNLNLTHLSLLHSIQNLTLPQNVALAFYFHYLMTEIWEFLLPVLMKLNLFGENMEVIITANQPNSLREEMCLNVLFCPSFACQLFKYFHETFKKLQLCQKLKSCGKFAHIKRMYVIHILQLAHQLVFVEEDICETETAQFLLMKGGDI